MCLFQQRHRIRPTRSVWLPRQRNKLILTRFVFDVCLVPPPSPPSSPPNLHPLPTAVVVHVCAPMACSDPPRKTTTQRALLGGSHLSCHFSSVCLGSQTGAIQSHENFLSGAIIIIIVIIIIINFIIIVIIIIIVVVVVVTVVMMMMMMVMMMMRRRMRRRMRMSIGGGAEKDKSLHSAVKTLLLKNVMEQCWANCL